MKDSKHIRIYIAKMFLNNKKEEKQFYKKAYDLISLLKKQGFEIIYVTDSEFKSYDKIYTFIESCNCLIAFGDRYTTSSTWRLSEMTYSLNGVGAFEKVDFNIPVFLYMGIGQSCNFINHFAKIPGVYTLSDNIEQASEEIRIFMKDNKK